MRDLYKRLGVDANASEQHIKSSLSLMDPTTRRDAEHILLDARRRKVYDRNYRALEQIGKLRAFLDLNNAPFWRAGNLADFTYQYVKKEPEYTGREPVRNSVPNRSDRVEVWLILIGCVVILALVGTAIFQSKEILKPLDTPQRRGKETASEMRSQERSEKLPSERSAAEQWVDVPENEWLAEQNQDEWVGSRADSFSLDRAPSQPLPESSKSEGIPPSTPSTEQVEVDIPEWDAVAEFPSTMTQEEIRTVLKNYKSAPEAIRLVPRPLPGNGKVLYLHAGRDPVAPLTIVTTNTAVNYLIKLEDYYSKEPILTGFIHGGKSAQFEVPLGSYGLKYAAGPIWYGKKFRFREQQVYVADEQFDFQRVGNKVRGYTVELFLQPGGNLEVNSIPAEAF